MNYLAFTPLWIWKSIHFYDVHCNVTKKRGSEIKQHTDHLHDPKRPCSPNLLHTTKTSDLVPDTSWLILPGAQHKIRNIQVFYSHRPAEWISQHPSPASHIHKNANKRSFPVIDYIHCPKAQAFFIQNVHKTLGSYRGLAFLEFFCSYLAKCQAQRNVLATNQALLANRTPHPYVYKSADLLPPECL